MAFYKKLTRGQEHMGMHVVAQSRSAPSDAKGFTWKRDKLLRPQWKKKRGNLDLLTKKQRSLGLLKKKNANEKERFEDLNVAPNSR